jgi:hypothetical protein
MASDNSELSAGGEGKSGGRKEILNSKSDFWNENRLGRASDYTLTLVSTDVQAAARSRTPAKLIRVFQ